ncbi:hypothetical protein ACFSL4_13260 [Streptomyces caeni]|uniref:Uncharacterized protein n=1 Tax=Streptomyces caeni TaxID=2307231 RepID=A0ABW4IQY6_9ACTN
MYGPARCEAAPVWDVGPWNTHDDHWNPSSRREQWKDLSRGLPEAQAAYQNGRSGGRDEFGRQVANRAGIDLADGTFCNVGLNDNGWVTVSWLRTDGGDTTSFPTWGTDVSIRAQATQLHPRGQPGRPDDRTREVPGPRSARQLGRLQQRRLVVSARLRRLHPQHLHRRPRRLASRRPDLLNP